MYSGRAGIESLSMPANRFPVLASEGEDTNDTPMNLMYQLAPVVLVIASMWTTPSLGCHWLRKWIVVLRSPAFASNAQRKPRAINMRLIWIPSSQGQATLRILVAI